VIFHEHAPFPWPDLMLPSDWVQIAADSIEHPFRKGTP
jgi:hypothetical protein